MPWNRNKPSATYRNVQQVSRKKTMRSTSGGTRPMSGSWVLGGICRRRTNKLISKVLSSRNCTVASPRIISMYQPKENWRLPNNLQRILVLDLTPSGNGAARPSKTLGKMPEVCPDKTPQWIWWEKDGPKKAKRRPPAPEWKQSPYKIPPGTRASSGA